MILYSPDRLDAVLRGEIKCLSTLFGDFLASCCQITPFSGKTGSPQAIRSYWI